ncbi:T9SS type A sorting domain-containing protein, partial [candidate division KSB1 bacterium]|nr:T9SS type A sorting domain-containing protein [candidate division KSB1 bacterium]
VSLAISNYATFSDRFEYAPGQFLPLEYYVYPAQLTTAKAAFATVPNMLRIFSERFGEYPFLKEKYGHAVFPWGGAMEHQTLTSIGSVSMSAEWVYAHELAHQWFGDLVTCENWGDIWLNEGFATYSEALYYRALNGVQGYHNYINASLGSMRSWGSDPVYRYNTDDVWYIFNRTVYDKGGWVLHTLRHVLGDSVFLKILHDYPNDPAFKFKSATTAQFRDYCEQVAGIDLDWFFQQWIYEPYFPVYQWGYALTPDQGGYSLYLEIRQTQAQVSPEYDHLYKMPIDIRVTYGDRTTQTLVVWDSLAVQSFRIPLANSPIAVSFDPDRWILREAQKIPVSAVLVNGETPRAFALMQNYPNPIVRNGTAKSNFVYTIPQTTDVELRIYDSLGREVEAFVLGKQTPGTYLVPFETKNLAAGIYLYRLRAGKNVATKKMAVVR